MNNKKINHDQILLHLMVFLFLLMISFYKKIVNGNYYSEGFILLKTKLYDSIVLL